MSSPSTCTAPIVPRGMSSTRATLRNSASGTATSVTTRCQTLWKKDRECYARQVATILLAGVDLFFRGKLEGLLPGHHLITVDSIDPPDIVIADIARIDPDEVADTYPDVPIVGYSNHTDTAGLRAAHHAGFDGWWKSGSGREAAATGVVRVRRRDVHHRRALHRHQRPLLRRRLSGRLHPRVRAHPHHRPRGVHRLRRLRARVP